MHSHPMLMLHDIMRDTSQRYLQRRTKEPIACIQQSANHLQVFLPLCVKIKSTLFLVCQSSISASRIRCIPTRLTMSSPTVIRICRSRLSSLVPFSNAKVSELKHLASYNWIQAKTPSIVVPGSPSVCPRRPVREVAIRL